MFNTINKTFLIVFSFVSFVAFGKTDPPTKSKKPNIVFLLTDDQRYDALGCYGNKDIITPNIDALSKTGIVFKNHYNTTSICMASRATIMTGMYENKTGCNFSHGPLIRDKYNKSYPVLLRKSGYYTGFAGKFGYAVKNSPDDKNGYHKEEDLPSDSFDWWAGWPGQGYYQTSKNRLMQKYAEKYPHVSTALGAAAIDFLDEAQKQDKPFCLSISFKAPHSPVSPNPEFDHVYANKTYKKPVNWGKEGAAHLPEQSKKGRQYTKLFKRWDEERYNESLSKYYQLIYGIDQAVGMINQKLKELGLDENTIVIFTTDNGYSCGAHAFGGKVLPYEEASRGPLIISGPKKYIKKQGSDNSSITGNIDMMPTILELAGLPVPNNVDGKSLVPIMNGKKKQVKEHQMILQVWGENPTHSMSIVKDNFKYLFWFYGGEGMTPKEELYNLDNDRYEMKNLANDNKYAKVLKEMRALYDMEVANWDKDLSEGNGYEKYTTLFDRNIKWEDKKHLMKFKKKKENPKKKKEGKKKNKKNKKKKKKPTDHGQDDMI